MAAAFTSEQLVQLAGLLQAAVGSCAPSGQVAQPSAETAQVAQPSPAPAAAPEWKPEIRYMSDRSSSSQITQQWEEIIHCYPMTVWQQENRGVNFTERFQEWIDLPVQMGLRRPLENTRHAIVTGYLLANRSDPRIANMTSLQKSAIQQLVKDACQAKVKKESRLKCLVALPPNPAELAKHAEEFAKHQSTKDLLSVVAFPVRCPFSPLEVKEVADSFQTRLAKRAAGGAATHAMDSSSSSCIMQMQMMQMQMMQTAMQSLGGVNNGPLGKRVRLSGDNAGSMAFGGGLQALCNGEPDAEKEEATAPQAKAEAAPQAKAEEAATEATPREAAAVAAAQSQTPQGAALELIEALRNRKPEPTGKPAKGSKKKAEGKGSSAAAAQTKPTKKDGVSRPACPKEGEKVEYLGGATIRLKKNKFVLRVPRHLTKEKRTEWTVERVIGSDKAQAFARALDKLEEIVHS